MALISQAPGRLAHQSGVPWDDPSGKRLRQWLGVTEEEFYDSSTFAILPLGFCYPGKGRGGDLPPRPECAPQWHGQLLDLMPKIELKVLIGAWAQRHYLGQRVGKNLTTTVRQFADYLPEFFPIPHPSPRNRIFLRKNPEIEQKIIPELSKIVNQFLGP